MAEEITEGGKVEISTEVIGTIAGIALSEVPGIAGMKGGFFKDIRRAATGKKDFSAGVEVATGADEDSCILDLYIIIEYEVTVTDIAKKAQVVVKEKIEAITGKKVESVNIHIVDIKLPDSMIQEERPEEK